MNSHPDTCDQARRFLQKQTMIKKRTSTCFFRPHIRPWNICKHPLALKSWRHSSIREKDEEELHKFAHTNSPLQKFKLYIHSNLLIIVHEYLKLPKL